MIRISRRFAVIMMMVFLLSVLTLEPECVQGYGSGNFPVFVESDAVFAISSNEFTITIQCLPLAGETPSFSFSNPILSPFISTKDSRGPPQSF